MPQQLRGQQDRDEIQKEGQRRVLSRGVGRSRQKDRGRETQTTEKKRAVHRFMRPEFPERPAGASLHRQPPLLP